MSDRVMAENLGVAQEKVKYWRLKSGLLKAKESKQ